MFATLRALTLVAICCASGSAAAHDPPAAPSRLVTNAISVEGAVEHKLTLRVEDLAKFYPARRAAELPSSLLSEANAAKVAKYRGVRLREILEKASIKAPDRHDVKKMIVIATASDGYKVVFTWSELFNSPVGDGVLVLFEKDGAPLGDDEGRISLISATDLRTGPRHVKWLRSLEVRKVVD